MKIQHIILLFLLISSIACSSTKLQKKGKVESENFYSTIKFDTYKSIIGFDVELNGVIKKFLFDTGADLNVVQRDTLIGKTSSYVGASKRKMKLGQETIALLKIGNTNFINTIALNGDFVGLKEQIPNFGGFIGQSIIRKANWLIDYPNKQLELSNRNLADASFNSIEIIRANGNNPYTFLELNGKKYKVVIDLGSSSTINLPKDSKFAKAVTQMIALSDHTRDRYTLGGLQKITEKIGVLPKITIGDFAFENVAVNINTSSQPRIGMNFFKEYIIYIDNSNGGIFKLKKYTK